MKWLAAFAAAIAVALAPIGVYADMNSRGGVITGYVANGASGTVTVTVTNPYGSGAAVSVGVNVFGGSANGQSQS